MNCYFYKKRGVMANEITDKDKVIMENLGKRLNILLKKVNLKKNLKTAKKWHTFLNNLPQ